MALKGHTEASRNWGDEDEEDIDENENNTGRGNRTYETVETRLNQKGQKVNFLFACFDIITSKLMLFLRLKQYQLFK
jgi:hypothetical protein